MFRKSKKVIYRLWHNKSAKGRVGYIGKDTDFPRRIRLSRRRKDKKCSKLYAALNKYPEEVWKVEVLSSGFCTNAALAKAEIEYIAKLDSVRKGYNITRGGEGFLSSHSEVTKNKIRRSLQGRALSEETKIKISKALIGREKSELTRYKLRLAHLGKRLSAVHRRKLSKAHMGKRASRSHCRAISLALMGNTNAKRS